jgi:hypothetical protein
MAASMGVWDLMTSVLAYFQEARLLYPLEPYGCVPRKSQTNMSRQRKREPGNPMPGFLTQQSLPLRRQGNDELTGLINPLNNFASKILDTTPSDKKAFYHA